ncbi:bifunctional tetrahydrofolate synthase/dihydrofolate synthase [Catenovulum sediminis]|uniref:Dihydrofolate synthase/folylpolyglutamate synthase n=1 Tax=Catenovulum sediminis TaxID=1740262 RepID=A0ABV1RHY4_9ALTE
MQSMASEPAKFKSVDEWLDYLTAIHPAEIDMGLTRTQQVFESLNLDFSNSRIVLIGGTNGKGTSCQLLRQILQKHGYSVGCYNSPHIHDYKERVTVNGEWLSSHDHCQAFQQVETARRDISLTYFEFGTLAALVLLAQQRPDFILLEVGLGGRLDATNVVQPEVSVITTVALDHQDWLGNDREKIGFEKAGIYRQNQKVVCGDANPPESVKNAVQQLACDAVWQGISFKYSEHAECWSWFGNKNLLSLSKPNMPLQNASTVLAVVEQLGIDLIEEQLNQVLAEFQMPGRWQKLQSCPDVYVDVAHNPEAVKFLSHKLEREFAGKTTLAVFGMLKDKDIEECLDIIKPQIDVWYLADINQPRGAKAAELYPLLGDCEVAGQYANIESAYQAALHDANEQTCVIAFGSFWVITDLMGSE